MEEEPEEFADDFDPDEVPSDEELNAAGSSEPNVGDFDEEDFDDLDDDDSDDDDVI